MSHHPKKLAIAVGGGPAPGINAVISAATIRSLLSGTEVVGVLDGFSHLMRGDVDQVRELRIEDVSRIHFRGGSILGIARANPTKNAEHLEECVLGLLRLGVDKLMTIGGDDTAFTASEIERQSKGRLSVAHVPKTIDNDLDLPDETATFGFETARQLGVKITESIMVDAETTKRWYFLVAMGRKAGHLALGIGKAAGATLTLIPEEFGSGSIGLDDLTDMLVAAIIKRRAYGGDHGVVVIAEGVVERMVESDLEQLSNVERDAHGHVRIAEVDIGAILKDRVRARLRELGLETTIVSKNIGYELRCADPMAYDLEYCRDLGYSAAKYLCEGGNRALVSMVHGRFEPIPFDAMMDPKTGRMRVRMVDVSCDRYMIARRYMVRLRHDDFDDPSEIARFASEAGLSLEAFEQRFRHLVTTEPAVRDFGPQSLQKKPKPSEGA